MEKFIILFLVIILSLMAISTVEAQEKYKLNLNLALERVLKENAEIKKAEKTLTKAKIEYKKAKANNLREQSNYNELEAKYDLESAKKDFKDTRNSVISYTIEQYSDVWLDKLNITVKEKTAAAEKRLLEQYEVQNKIGDLSNLDLLEQRNTYQDAYFELEKVQDSYEQSLKQLKQTLALEGKELEISPLVTLNSLEISEDEAINTALTNNLSLQLNKIEKELADIDQQRTKVSDSVLNIEISKLASEIVDLEIKNIEDDLTVSAQGIFYDYQQAVKNVKLEKKFYDKNENEYELIQEQYQAGISTKTDLMQYEADMLESKYDYKFAIANLYLAEQELKSELGLETGVFNYDSND